MTDELATNGPDAYIDRFISIAPKSYAYRVVTSDGNTSECCKVKGITLNHTNSLKIDLASIEQLLDIYFRVGEDEQVARDSENSIRLNYRAISRTPLHEIVTRDETKTCGVVLTKRRYVSRETSLPFGYRSKS
ncbi:hypothetical protein QAD02_003556 [Eretmocerus hayati]|uniref:Uncharacterized protein n=1 Tax=Eretmocerus hayati TaxID=131215 RepID=A0ACC2NPX3_9HYME|nr:hypothetical protein QAD02_003556 [Eretmocerus hayati]